MNLALHLLAHTGQPARECGRDLIVITLDQEDLLEEDGHKIRVVPAWQWLD